MRPSVTVVIPCYNHARYLPLALRSVMAQTFTRWEAIVVNDGSTDDTATVIAQFTDPRIRHIDQENQGLSAARNAGIRAAKGEYLAFLDADDEWLPQFLHRCVAVLDAEATLAGVYTQNYFIDQEGKVLPQLGGRPIRRTLFRTQLPETWVFPPCAALVRNAIVREVGLFDTQLTSVEDLDLWLRIGKRYEMWSIPEPLVRYRIYPGSMSTNAERMHQNLIKVLAKYFGDPVGDPATWAEEKRRAYGLAYRSAALQHIQGGQPDAGWAFLSRAVVTWPGVMERLDTLYELACGETTRGYRGQANLMDLSRNGTEMLSRLEALFDTPSLQPVRQKAYGNAYLALAMLSDQAGQWPRARNYLFRALVANPRLAATPGVLRRLLKVTFLTPRLMAAVKSQKRAG